MIQNSPVSGISFQFVHSNGIRLRLAMAGDNGPLVLLVHGWPESWYSWRHQMLALAAAGYRAVAPDMRGYGESDAPEEIAAYDIKTLAADLTGILDALGEQRAILIGHDWGAIVAWHAVLLHPERFTALVAMSVPYGGRPQQSPIDFWKNRFKDRFFYILYHQEPGIAEAEYDADPEGILSALYCSPDTPRAAPEITDKASGAGGWIKRFGKPLEMPAWLTQKDLNYLVSQFKLAGFRGGVNYYRNFHRNWEITAELDNANVKLPTLFIAGAGDNVIRGSSQEQLHASMSRVVDDLRGVIVFPDAGHWIQQELPEQTNAAILAFFREINC